MLQAEFGTRLTFEVINQPFQEFTSQEQFDMILYNHAFEYLKGDRLKWIQKSLNLLSDQGNILIFSPNIGGINKIYGEVMKDVNGFDPFFSDDIERMLSGNSIEFGQRADRRLRVERVIGLTTVRKDGAPQPVPVWFLWNGETALIFTPPNTQKLRNLAYTSKAALHLDSDGRGGDIIVLEVEGRC